MSKRENFGVFLPPYTIANEMFETFILATLATLQDVRILVVSPLATQDSRRWLIELRSTSVDEFEDAAEAGVVRLDVVSVELEDEVRSRGVEATLSQRWQRVITTQLVVPLVLFVHLRTFQVQKQPHEVRAPAHHVTSRVQSECAIIQKNGAKCNMHVLGC